MKKLGLLTVVSLMFTACGGGGGSSSTEYDMWDYIASKTSKTVLLDKFASNSSYTLTGNKNQNAGYIEYTVNSSSEKVIDFNGEATATVLLNGNSLKVANTEVGRYKSIGSKLGVCTLEAHYDTFTVATDYTFSDVLEFNCVDYKEFYAKDKGNITNYTKTSIINGSTTTTSYGISVANNW